MPIRNLQHLKTLIRVAETGRFSLAARDLRLSEAAVSMQMRQLEQDLNTEIFDRSSHHRPVLNQKGRLLLQMARDMMRITEDVDDALAGRNEISGTLRIGAIYSALIGVLPRALTQMQQKHPAMTFQVVDGLSEELHRMLERGDIDCALVIRQPDISEQFQWHPFAKEYFDVVTEPSVTITDIDELFATYNYTRLSRKLATGKIIEAALQSRGIMVTPWLEIGISDAIAKFVHYGMGVGILPRRLLAPNPYALRRIPFFETEVFRELGLLERFDNVRSRSVHALHAVLHQINEDELAALPAAVASGRDVEMIK